jgi:hypothetical protein
MWRPRSPLFSLQSETRVATAEAEPHRVAANDHATLFDLTLLKILGYHHSMLLHNMYLSKGISCS